MRRMEAYACIHAQVRDGVIRMHTDTYGCTHIIINMNIEYYIIYYSLSSIPYWLFPIGYSLLVPKQHHRRPPARRVVVLGVWLDPQKPANRE